MSSNPLSSPAFQDSDSPGQQGDLLHRLLHRDGPTPEAPITPPEGETQEDDDLFGAATQSISTPSTQETQTQPANSFNLGSSLELNLIFVKGLRIHLDRAGVVQRRAAANNAQDAVNALMGLVDATTTALRDGQRDALVVDSICVMAALAEDLSLPKDVLKLDANLPVWMERMWALLVDVVKMGSMPVASDAFLSVRMHVWVMLVAGEGCTMRQQRGLGEDTPESPNRLQDALAEIRDRDGGVFSEGGSQRATKLPRSRSEILVQLPDDELLLRRARWRLRLSVCAEALRGATDGLSLMFPAWCGGVWEAEQALENMRKAAK